MNGLGHPTCLAAAPTEAVGTLAAVGSKLLLALASVEARLRQALVLCNEEQQSFTNSPGFGLICSSCSELQTLTEWRLAPGPLHATDALRGSGHRREARVADIHSNGARRCGGELDFSVLHVWRRPAAQL